jgi:hypothetical protein
MKASVIPIAAIAVLVLALLSSFSPRTPPPPSAIEHSASAAPVEPGDRSTSDRRRTAVAQSSCAALCQLSEFLGIDPSLDPPESIAAIEAELARRKMPPIRTLIAVVPDPVDSQLKHVFDQHIEAIRAALDRLSFVPDRFFDPWHLERSRGDEHRTLYREQPGALLFRRRASDGADALLLVLLVGETPTSGVQKRALSSAFDLAHTLEQHRFAVLRGRAAQSTAVPTVQILGPASSGAAASLEVVITHWAHERLSAWRKEPRALRVRELPARVEIISGSATSLTARRRLETDLNAQLARDAGDRAPPLTATFHSTVASEDESRRVALDFLEQRLGARPEEIVMLTETTTSDLQPRYVGDGARVRRARFPLHISQLRAAYVDNSHSVDENSPHLILRPSLEDVGKAVDELASASPLSGSSTELALAGILHTVAVAGAHYVAIVASDSRDTIFLAEEVHKFFPDVQLLLFSSDLLFIHDQLPDLSGALVVSSYPPFPWAQRSVFPFDGARELLPFATDPAEGVFNAATLLLGDSVAGTPVDYSAPFAIPRRAQLLRPHPWISVVGRGEFYPVDWADGCDHRTLPDCEDFVQPLLAPSNPPLAETATARINTVMWQWPRAVGFDLLVLLTSLIGIGFGVFFLLKPKLDSNRWRPLELFVPSRAKGLLNRGHILLFFAVLIVIHAALLALQCIEVTAHDRVAALCAPLGVAPCIDRTRLLLPVLQPLLIGSLSVVATGAIVSLLPREDGDGRPWIGVACLLLWLTLTGVVDACRLYERWLTRQGLGSPRGVTAMGRSLVFFVDRACNLGSGASLLTFAVLVGLAWLLWIVGHLRTAQLIHAVRQLDVWKLWPDRTAESLIHELGIADQVHSLHRRITSKTPSARTLGVIAAIIAVAAVLVRPSLLLPLEGHAIFVACQILFWAMLACCFAVFIRLLATWIGLRTVTERLAAHPLREAFARVPADAFDTFDGHAGEQLNRLWCEQVRLIANHFNGSRTLRALLADLVSDLALDAPANVSQVLAAEVTVLGRFWRSRPLAAATQISLPLEESARLATTSAAELYARALPDESHLWMRLWEDLVATRLAVFIAYVREHLNNYLTFITASMILIMLAGASYPFHGGRLLFVVLGIALATIVVGTVTVLIQMNRDAIISRLTSTEPGEITWDRSFVSGILVHGAVPIIGLIAVRFPQIARPLFAWADPLVKILSQ